MISQTRAVAESYWRRRQLAETVSAWIRQLTASHMAQTPEIRGETQILRDVLRQLVRQPEGASGAPPGESVTPLGSDAGAHHHAGGPADGGVAAGPAPPSHLEGNTWPQLLGRK